MLLDTHYVYALIGAPVRLNAREIDFLEAHSDQFIVSAVSLWEIHLKWRARFRSGARKGPIGPQKALTVLRAIGVPLLALTPLHTANSLLQAPPHADPFDEMLLMQAQAEGVPLLSRDASLAGHPVVLIP